MLKPVAVVGISVVFAGCVNQVQTIEVLGFSEVTPDCVSDPTAQRVLGGAVDVAAGEPQYVVGVVLGGTGPQGDGVMLRTGEVLEPAFRSKAVVREVTVTYESARRLPASVGAYTQRVTVTPPAGMAAAGSQILLSAPVNLISPQLGTFLFDTLTPDSSASDVIDIVANVEAKGEFSDSQVPFSTGRLAFPLRAFRSAPPACAGSQRFQRYPATTDRCAYVGQFYGTFGLPPPPATCCDPTMPTCL